MACSLVAEEYLTGQILQHFQELKGKGLTLILPSVTVGRLGHGSGNLADILMFVKV